MRYCFDDGNAEESGNLGDLSTLRRWFKALIQLTGHRNDSAVLCRARSIDSPCKIRKSTKVDSIQVSETPAQEQS